MTIDKLNAITTELARVSNIQLLIEEREKEMVVVLELIEQKEETI